MRTGILICVILAVCNVTAWADIERTLSYQGVLQDGHGDPVPDGDYNVRFSLFSRASGGTGLWTEVRTITCTEGLFSIILGEVAPLDLPFDTTYWLELTLSGEDPMEPRVQLTTVPYAITALNAGAGGDDDWIIDGDDIYHELGRVAIGYAPEGGDNPTGAKLEILGSTCGVFGHLHEVNATADERAAVYGYRSLAVSNPGSGYGKSQTNTAVTGVNSYGDPYTFGVAGYTDFSNANTAGVLGANTDATTWGALAFKETSGQPWGLYTPGAAYVGATLVSNYVQIPMGAQNGYVLTSDYNGFASWQPSAGGFELPYYGTTTYTGSAFKVGNLDTGNGAAMEGHCSGKYGAYFTSSKPVASATGLYAEATGDGDFQSIGVYGLATPADNYGYGGYFRGGNKGVWGKVISSEVNPVGYYAVDGLVEGYYGFNYGVRGRVTMGDNYNYGVYGECTAAGANYGVYGAASNGSTNYAGYFSGNVHVNGTLSKSGGSFKIDHPLDPENKYLSHSFVESPDMMNVYNGNVTLDAAGEAWVTMPDYFEALNRDFRYQLTAIGGPGPNLYIAEKISGNSFRISGGAPGLEVSWQVTGIRQDPFANAHRIQVEEPKRPEEQGKYLNPEAFGQSAELGLHVPPQLEEAPAPDEQ